MSNINLDITDFGPINKANIELKKLNVIAGVNGSGKTTSSKLLYCFLTSNSKEGIYLANKSVNTRFASLIVKIKQDPKLDPENLERLSILSNNAPKLTDENYNSIMDNHINSLKKLINDTKMDKNEYITQLKAIEHILEVNSIEPRRYFNVSNTLLSSEFNFHDLELYPNSHIKFYGQGNDCEFSHEIISNEDIIGFKIDEGYSNCLNIENIIYIDSMSIFDNLKRHSPYHLKSLSKLLNSPENNDDVYDNEFNKKLDKVKKRFDDLIGGQIYYDVKANEFIFKKGNKHYSMKNTASGIKQLGIIQLLLSNRSLTEDSFLIMDEPEVNIHPEWQIKLAQILVLLAKELNCNIYLNTHSPFIAEAIEVYSKYYRIYDETAFYLTQKADDEDKYDFIRMDDADILDVYNNLGYAFDTLNRIRFKTEIRDDLGE